MTRLFCGTPDSEQMFRTERQLLWEENHVIFRQNPPGSCRNPGEIGRERGCIVRGIALFCQNPVLFFQNHIKKFRTPRFITRAWETISSLPDPHTEMAGDHEVKDDVEKSCAALIAGCRRTGAPGFREEFAADYTDFTN